MAEPLQLLEHVLMPTGIEAVVIHYQPVDAIGLCTGQRSKAVVCIPVLAAAEPGAIAGGEGGQWFTCEFRADQRDQITWLLPAEKEAFSSMAPQLTGQGAAADQMAGANLMASVAAEDDGHPISAP
jgi:hypothetical protein